MGPFNLFTSEKAPLLKEQKRNYQTNASDNNSNHINTNKQEKSAMTDSKATTHSSGHQKKSLSTQTLFPPIQPGPYEFHLGFSNSRVSIGGPLIALNTPKLK